MILINDYQKTLYDSLIVSGYKVFDNVPTNEDLPIIVIGDYTLSCGNVKNECYNFNQKIDIYSEYEGKKEINDMITSVIVCVNKLVNKSINDNYFISTIRLSESPVGRDNEGFYYANLNFEIETEEV